MEIARSQPAGAGQAQAQLRRILGPAEAAAAQRFRVHEQGDAVAFAIAYRHGPSRQKAKWRWVILGAVVASLAWLLGSVAGWFPLSGGYSFSLAPSWSAEFLASLARHWFLPFLSLFLVAFGGWAIGMRNMVIYELEADYCHYLEALGAPRRLVRRYAFRNALLPQLTGLALQLGVLVAGALVTEIVFSYPGLGYLILQAINNQDFFLIQGAFLFIIIGVLAANFLVDIVYVLVDPRTRTGMRGAT